MILHKILCEICDEPLVKAYLPNLSRPLIASMFEPLDEGHIFPFPDPNTTWEWMKCPHCKSRPFIISEQQASDAVSGNWPGPEKVKTDKGEYVIYSSTCPGIPPQINVQIHTEEELEQEWAKRSGKTAGKPKETSQTKSSGKPSETQFPKSTAKKRKK